MRTPTPASARRLTVVLLLLLAFLFAPARASWAQSSDLNDRLPPDTLFYLYWRGSESLGSGNNLVALWNDPGFAPVRRFLLEQVAEAAARNPRLARLPSAEWEALLSNPLLIGARLASPATGPNRRPQGFLIVDARGEAAPKAKAILDAAGPDFAPIARLTPAGYVVVSHDSVTFDQLSRRFASTATSTENSLGALPAYHDTRQELGERPALEFFLRLPDLSQVHPEKLQGFNMPAFVHALHLERIHALCAGLDLRSPTTVTRFAILGDTAPGSPFDLFGTNVSSFATLRAAPAAASINISRLDFGALVADFLNAVAAAAPQDQVAQLKMVGGMVTSSVIPVLGGEFAQIWTNPQAPPRQTPPLIAVTIRQPDAANQLFQNTLAPFLKPAGQQGEVRYFRTNAPKASSAPAASGNDGITVGSNFLALLPDLLLGSQDEQLVRDRAAALLSRASGGLADNPRFRAARAELPPELSGLAYFDLEQFDWSQWARQGATRMSRQPRLSDRSAPLSAWVEAGGAAVYARHLHQFILGSWKGPSGIHWRGSLN